MTNQFVQSTIDFLCANKETYEKLIAENGKRATDNMLIANMIEQEMNGAGDDYPLIELPRILCERIVSALRNNGEENRME